MCRISAESFWQYLILRMDFTSHSLLILFLSLRRLSSEHLWCLWNKVIHFWLWNIEQCSRYHLAQSIVWMSNYLDTYPFSIRLMEIFTWLQSIKINYTLWYLMEIWNFSVLTEGNLFISFTHEYFSYNHKDFAFIFTFLNMQTQKFQIKISNIFGFCFNVDWLRAISATF